MSFNTEALKLDTGDKLSLNDIYNKDIYLV